MPNAIEKCQSKLCRLLNRKYGILTGRGATALWIAYSMTDPDRPKVLLPAMVCLSPMFAVHFANRIPIFADVRRDDATLDPREVEKMLNRYPDIGAVLAVHLYGHSAMMTELEKICERHDVLLIEDLAQALGGKDSHKNLFGSNGDISIASFGHTKVLDVGVGGGFFTDNEYLARKAQRVVKQLRSQPKNQALLSECYQKLYYTVYECGQKKPSIFRLFDHFPKLFQDLYLFNINTMQADNILSKLDHLSDEVAIRNSVARTYQKTLTGTPGISFFNPSGTGVAWRFTFRVDWEVRDALLSVVRNAGYDISSWYPSITEWTPSGRLQKKESFPVANQLEREVVNLWVTSEYQDGKAEELGKLIKSFMEGI